VDAEGNILRLEEQNRSQWDQSLIARRLLSSAAILPPATKPASIIFKPPSPPATARRRITNPRNWPRILSLYDRLIEIDDSPVVALNRGRGPWPSFTVPRAGIEAIEAIHKRDQLSSYYLLYATLGEFQAPSGQLPGCGQLFSAKPWNWSTIESEQNVSNKKNSGNWKNCQKIGRTQAAR